MTSLLVLSLLMSIPSRPHRRKEVGMLGEGDRLLLRTAEHVVQYLRDSRLLLPLVSVVISVFNVEATIEDAIAP